MVLRSIGLLLRGLGNTVIAAEGGAAGVEEFSRRPGEIDLVVLDMVMPVDELLLRGRDGFLQKPFSPAALSAKLVEILGEGGG